MKLPDKIKLYIFSFVILLSCSFLVIYPVKADSKGIFNNIQTNQTYYSNKPVLIRLNANLPDTLEDQRIAAFKILRPMLSKKISTATVLWQKDDFSFGKKASVSSAYITDFLNKKISIENFIDHINLELIEPVPVRKNNIDPVKPVEVSQINMTISAKLREKADLYRIDGGNNESALRIYNQVIELNPNDYISLYWIGKIYNDRNKPDLAKEYFSRALGLNPDFKAADDALYVITKDKN